MCSCRGVSCTVALWTACEPASARSSVPAGKGLFTSAWRPCTHWQIAQHMLNRLVSMPCWKTRDADAAWQAKPCTSVPKTALQCSCAAGGPPQHKCSNDVRASRYRMQPCAPRATTAVRRAAARLAVVSLSFVEADLNTYDSRCQVLQATSV